MPEHPTRRIPKPWGYELLFASTDRYAGKILHVEKGKRLSRQYHQKKVETLYVHSGEMELEIGDGSPPERLVMRPGDSYHLPAGTVHRMTALQDTDVLEVSTPELDDVVRLEDDFGRTGGERS